MYTEKTPFEIKPCVYRISKDYIKNLRTADRNIADPEVTNRYYGPVAQINSMRGPVNLFVPIDPSYETTELFTDTFEDGVFAGIMDFKQLIPAFMPVMTIDTSNLKLIRFCENNREIITEYANDIIETSEKIKRGEIKIPEGDA